MKLYLAQTFVDKFGVIVPNFVTILLETAELLTSNRQHRNLWWVCWRGLYTTHHDMTELYSKRVDVVWDPE